MIDNSDQSKLGHNMTNNVYKELIHNFLAYYEELMKSDDDNMDHILQVIA